MKKLLLAILACVLLASAFAACGGGDSTSTDTGETSAAATTEAASEESEIPTSKQGYPLMDDGVFDERVRYAADPEGKLAFYISEASASPGRIKFQFVNPQSVPHNVALEAPNGETIGETETITEGATTAHFTVKPGVYVLYCSVPGHRKAGMVGHLTVK
jgi:plastocyanin